MLTVRLQRTTMRERVLLGGLLLAAIIYAPIAAVDWRTAQEDRYIDASSDLAAARLAQSASRRIAAIAPDKAAIDDMNSWGFETSNIAVAQVALEQRLMAGAEAAEMTNVKITTDLEVEVIGPTQWLGAEIQSDLKWSPAFHLLESIASWPEGARITAFKYEVLGLPMGMRPVNGVLPLGRLTIGVSAPVILAAPEPAP